MPEVFESSDFKLHVFATFLTILNISCTEKIKLQLENCYMKRVYNKNNTAFHNMVDYFSMESIFWCTGWIFTTPLSNAENWTQNL